MKGFLKQLIFILTGMLIATGTASADEVRLKNGDRITGTFIRMEAGKVIFRTDYAGEMQIDWHKVESLSAEKKIKVVLDDSTALEGQTLPLESGKMKLQTEKLEEPSVFDLADVSAINPKVEPPVKIIARVNAGLVLERGNSDTDDYEIDVSFLARTKKSRYGLGGDFNKEKTAGDLTA